jgi:hypothetical protein
VFARISKLLLVFALIAMLGAHWAFLQTIAWTTMLANNLRTQSLTEAVSYTFDGNHPCPLCKAIAAGKKSENKNAVNVQTQKLEYLPLAQKIVLIAPSALPYLPLKNCFAKSFFDQPLLPPPRGFFV